MSIAVSIVSSSRVRTEMAQRVRASALAIGMLLLGTLIAPASAQDAAKPPIQWDMPALLEVLQSAGSFDGVKRARTDITWSQTADPVMNRYFFDGAQVVTLAGKIFDARFVAGKDALSAVEITWKDEDFALNACRAQLEAVVSIVEQHLAPLEALPQPTRKEAGLSPPAYRIEKVATDSEMRVRVQSDLYAARGEENAYLEWQGASKGVNALSADLSGVYSGYSTGFRDARDCSVFVRIVNTKAQPKLVKDGIPSINVAPTKP